MEIFISAKLTKLVWNSVNYLKYPLLQVQLLTKIKVAAQNHILYSFRKAHLGNDLTSWIHPIPTDKKLKWGPHVNRILQKAKHCSLTLKRLKGSQWGPNRPTLKMLSVHRLDLPLLELDAPVSTTASKSLLSEIDKMRYRLQISDL